jgi:hypothetical protein
LTDRLDQVVVADRLKDTAEPVERLNVRLQERLLGLAREQRRT